MEEETHKDCVMKKIPLGGGWLLIAIDPFNMTTQLFTSANIEFNPQKIVKILEETAKRIKTGQGFMMPVDHELPLGKGKC